MQKCRKTEQWSLIIEDKCGNNQEIVVCTDAAVYCMAGRHWLHMQSNDYSTENKRKFMKNIANTCLRLPR